MQTQIQCPQCGTPFAAEVHQIIDADQNPGLKQQLLAGQLNVAVCPNCGAGGQLATPLVYHDSAHELFMIHVPQAINMNQMEREQLIGRMARQVVDNLPPEKRKAYLLQPQTVLSMQTFMENVLETEGITKEMIARQQKQSELLNTLIRADKDVVDHLLQERISEIDETFFSMLQSYLDMAQQMQDDKQLVRLTNLRARLMTETAAGRQLEKEQMALHKLSRVAKKEGGLTPALLLQHLLQNLDNPGVLHKLMMSGQQAINYELFTQLTAEIEKETDEKRQQQLQQLREDLLTLQSEMQAASKRVLDNATNTLNALLQAPDRQQAIQQRMEEIDDAFMYVLSASIAQAQQQQNDAQLQALSEIQSLIIQQIESQYPPEVILLNQLMEAEDEAEQARLLDNNAELVQPRLIQMLDALEDQVAEMNQPELNERLQAVKQMIQTRL